MNSSNILENLCQIFEQKIIDNKLLFQFKSENVSQLKTTLKIYILEFLLDSNDKNAKIAKSNDIWFIQENSENSELCFKYIELMINLINAEKLNKVNINNEIDMFINTKIGNKVFYLISILNKFYLPDTINLLFIGFALGESQEFIRNNFFVNLKELLFLAKSEITQFDKKMNICSLNENILECINVYFLFLIFFRKDIDSINSIKSFLFNSLPNGINLNNYYKQLEQAGLLKYLYSNKDNIINNNSLYQQKALECINNIIENIKNIHIMNNSLDLKIDEENEEVLEISDNEEEQTIISSKTNESQKEIIPIYKNKENISMNNYVELEKNVMPVNNNQKNNIQIQSTNEGQINPENNDKKDSLNIPKKANANYLNQDDNKINFNGEENISFQNNIAYSENNVEKETNSNSSIISQKSKIKEDIFQNIFKFIDYPKYSELIVDEKENQDDKDFYTFSNSISFLFQLNQKVSDLKNMLKYSIFDISSFVQKAELETKIRLSSLTNLKLEILINILKNPNIINIKRKLIEIITFHLMSENADYFNLNSDYQPSEVNFQNLEKMITYKLSKNKNDKKILNDLKRLSELKSNINSKKEEDSSSKVREVYIDLGKKDKLFLAKNFLDFYKSLLNEPVHISYETSNYYLLPRNLFNSEIEVNKYLLDLKSILSENEEEKEIIGLFKDKEIINIDMYNEQKLLDIKEASKILFSFNSQFINIENQATKIIKDRKNDYLRNIKKTDELYKDIFTIDEANDEKCKYFEENINSQIDECVDIFEKNVIIKIKGLIEHLFEGNIDNEKKNIVYNIRKFFTKFLENSQIRFINKVDYPDINKLLIFLNAKLLVLNRVGDFFDEIKKCFLAKLSSEKSKFDENITKVISNLKKLKNSITQNYNFEKKNDAYEKWKSTDEIKKRKIDDISLEKLIGYINDNIKQKLNLEMVYTYDAKFCLWSIKHGYDDYFTY